jgi:hypothetical protein
LVDAMANLTAPTPGMTALPEDHENASAQVIDFSRKSVDHNII